MVRNYNEVLYEKMQKEYNSFIEKLRLLPPEKIIDRAYEKVMKENILCACEDGDLLQPQAKALYHLKNSLEDLYQEWLKADDSLMEDLEYSIKKRADSAVKDMVKKNTRGR